MKEVTNNLPVVAAVASTLLLGACGGGGGGAGPEEVTPPTTDLVYRADADTLFIENIYGSSFDGTESRTITDSMVAPGILKSKLSPDGNHLAMIVGDDVLEEYHLFVDDLRDTAPPVSMLEAIAQIDGDDVGSFPPVLSEIIDFKWSPDSEFIAFAAGSSANAERIYVTPVDFSSLLPLANPNFNPGFQSGVTAFDWDPSSGSNTHRLAMIANFDNEDSYELFVTPIPAVEIFKTHPALAVGDNVTQFQWAPDGSRIAYLASQMKETLVVDLFSSVPLSNLAEISNAQINGALVFGGDVSKFSWAPDSSQIAYLANQHQAEHIQLYIAGPAGGDTRVSLANGEVVEDPEDVFYQLAIGNVTSFKWSPDSGFIAYRADQDTADQYELFNYGIASMQTTKANDVLPAEGDVKPDAFAWSPDNILAYRADQDVNNKTDLYIATILGSIKLNNTDGEVVGFNWAPDGSRLAFRSAGLDPEVYELYTVLPNVDSDQQAMNGGEVAGTRNVRATFRWSLDSQTLAFRANELDDADTINLYSVSANGTENTIISIPLIQGGSVERDFEWRP